MPCVFATTLAFVVYLVGSKLQTLRHTTGASSHSVSETMGTIVEDAFTTRSSMSVERVGTQPPSSVGTTKLKPDPCGSEVCTGVAPMVPPTTSERKVIAVVHGGHGVGQLFAVVNSGVSVAVTSNRTLHLVFEPSHEVLGTMHGGSFDDWLHFFGLLQEDLPFTFVRNSTASMDESLPGYVGDQEVCNDTKYEQAPLIHVTHTICHTITPDTACFWRGLFWRLHDEFNKQERLSNSSTNVIRIAVHIRQGDIYKGNIWKDRRLSPDYIKGILSRLLPKIKELLPDFTVHVGVYSNKGPLRPVRMIDFLSEHIPESQMTINMKSADEGGAIFKDMAAFASADIFIGSKSQASLTSAFLNRGSSILPQWKPFVLTSGGIEDVLELDPEQLGADLEPLIPALLNKVKKRLQCRNSILV